MASSFTLPEQSVISEQYGELVILVPEWLQEHSEELFDNQKRAIDLGAVLGEDVDSHTIDYLELGWAFEEPRHCCWHMNIPPVRREELCTKYSTWIPLSLIERTRYIVAGVFAIPVNEGFSLPRERICRNLEIEWPCFKKYLEELSTYIDSAERYIGSLVMILRTYRYNQT
jgi:hypothetical protein